MAQGIDDESFQIMHDTPPDVRAGHERMHNRQDHVLQDVAIVRHQNRTTLIGGVFTTTGYLALTQELHRVVWPDKFKLDLPPLYDGSTNPTEFLPLYTINIQATRAITGLWQTGVHMAPEPP
ncbi:Serine/threonine-protein kinase HT1 [Hordeum vulgare]|nr:Serine/threonine-protein kinase HT1 [Hordeum vulgare]